jgi:tRNA/rRNA methyltransferase
LIRPGKRGFRRIAINFNRHAAHLVSPGGADCAIAGPMSGAGTDRTAEGGGGAGPVIILVEPQLAENIGMAARAMANFGLSELRLVKPRDGWPTGGGLPKGAHAAASGAVHILEQARLFPDARSAIADLHRVYATTARNRGQMKRVYTPAEMMPDTAARIAAGQRVGILFGRERTGLENDEISLADAIITYAVNPRFASLNLAQAVLLAGHEWFKAAHGEAKPFGDEAQAPAEREMVVSLFGYLEDELDRAGFFPPDKREIMARNLRDILHRLEMTEQEVRTLRGAFGALAEGRRRRGRVVE